MTLEIPETAKRFAAEHGRYGIIGRSDPMQRVYDAIAAVAETQLTVTVRGESGTGKELVARAVHVESRNRDKFVAVNCAAIPEGTLESELFGHVRGAFTGALADRVGRFQDAHRGTILLDEIGDMASATQAKLLRVIQEKEVTPLGRNHAIFVDVRVIAATNANLEQRVSYRQFREDLYYRLMVFPIVLPPLRERKEDIGLLAEYFIHKHNPSVGTRLEGLAMAAVDFLMQSDWNGNVRQLESVIHCAMVWRARTHSGGALDLPDLRAGFSDRHSLSLREPQEEFGCEDFWQAVARPFTERRITKDEVEQHIRRGLQKSRGSYRELVRLFNLPDSDYRRFMDFLRRHEFKVDFRPYRKDRGMTLWH